MRIECFYFWNIRIDVYKHKPLANGIRHTQVYPGSTNAAESMKFALTLLSIASLISAEITAESALGGLLGRCDKRYPTFHLALDIAHKRGFENIVETGTARNGASNCGGDGCSTVVFSRFASDKPIHVASVDINPDSVRESQQAVAEFPGTTVFESDSVAFLKSFSGPIDLLYLDSYDYEPSNPQPSQDHHLKEIIAAYDKLHEDSVVMVDDCELPGGGKCRLVELFLSELGWRTIMKGYQIVMVTSKPVVL